MRLGLLVLAKVVRAVNAQVPERSVVTRPGYVLVRMPCSVVGSVLARMPRVDGWPIILGSTSNTSPLFWPFTAGSELSD